MINGLSHPYYWDESMDFFGVLRGRNLGLFPIIFRRLFTQFEEKNPNQKKKKIFFLNFSFSHHTHTSYMLTI